MVQASLVPLALGIGADVYVVVAKVSGSTVDGTLAAAALLLGVFGLWWCMPWFVRAR